MIGSVRNMRKRLHRLLYPMVLNLVLEIDAAKLRVNEGAPGSHNVLPVVKI